GGQWFGWGRLRVFFFQAEDGIRDGHVTGVQTCALPISSHRLQLGVNADQWTMRRRGRAEIAHKTIFGANFDVPNAATRSVDQHEIGRASLGKECRSRWSPYQ